MTLSVMFWIGVITSFIICDFTGAVTIGDLNAKKLSNSLKEIANTVTGLKYVQEKFNSLEYRRDQFNGPSLVREFATILSKQFRSRVQTVEKLRDVIEEEYEFFTDSRNPRDALCCKLHDYEMKEVPKFSSKVDLDRLCVHRSATSRPNTKYATSKILKTMKENYERFHELKWQYFAAEDGLYFNWPANNFDPTCTQYDHRFRPFYVEAATPRPKDVVIVLDESKSMDVSFNAVKQLMDMAVETAETILETLNPRDKVGLITFSQEARVPSDHHDDCYSKMLAEASPKNIEYLKAWVSQYQTNGGTRYAPAIEKAFTLLENTPSGEEERDKVILFLTDGQPEELEQQIMQTIHHCNARLNNSVIIMTYLLGTGKDEKTCRILLKMASQEGFNPKHGNVTAGLHTLVSDPKRLRTEMGSYYSFFSWRYQSRKAITTIPYVDAFSKNLIISILLPVYHKGRFIGVVGTDINVSDLLEHVTYFKRGETSYAFLLDGKGRLITHPLLPRPLKVEEPPLFVHGSDIEYKAASMGVIHSMMRLRNCSYPGTHIYTWVKERQLSGESGKASFDTNHVLSRGTREEGVNNFKIFSHYFWHPIPFSNTSVCVVLSDKDTRAILKNKPLPSSKVFVYHDLRLQPRCKKCKYFQRQANIESSAVKFSPFAFLRPLSYIFRDEVPSDVKKYAGFMEGTSWENPGFKASIRAAVSATAHAEDFWMKVNSVNDSRSVVWQKFGTFEGVLRMYPATRLPKTYDHTREPWFQRTIGHRGLHVVSAPRDDDWGAGNVVTVSSTIFHGMPGVEYSHDDRIAGVMATDFTVPYLYTKMMESNDACSHSTHRCFIMDSSGFIVMHLDLVNDDIQQKALEPIHIIEKLPWIAEVLISQGILEKKGCVDYKTIRIYNTWLAKVGKRYEHAADTGSIDFILDVVEDTNVFLGIYDVSVLKSSSCVCVKRNGLGECTSTTTTRQTCECPCYLNAKDVYAHCENRFNPSSDSRPTCSPRTERTNALTDNNAEKTANLERCIDHHCKRKSGKGQCLGLTGCRWCEQTNTTQPGCQYNEDSCELITRDQLSDVQLGLIVAFSILLTGIIIGSVAFASIFKRRQNRKIREPRPEIHAEQTQLTPRDDSRDGSVSTPRTSVSSIDDLNQVSSIYISTIQDEMKTWDRRRINRGTKNNPRQFYHSYSNELVRPIPEPIMRRSLSDESPDDDVYDDEGTDEQTEQKLPATMENTGTASESTDHLYLFVV